MEHVDVAVIGGGQSGLAMAYELSRRAHPGLAFVGLEWQRSLSSNSLRGVGCDAARAARHLAHLLGHS